MHENRDEYSREVELTVREIIDYFCAYRWDIIQTSLPVVWFVILVDVPARLSIVTMVMTIITATHAQTMEYIRHI